MNKQFLTLAHNRQLCSKTISRWFSLLQFPFVQSVMGSTEISFVPAAAPVISQQFFKTPKGARRISCKLRDDERRWSGLKDAHFILWIVYSVLL